MYFISTILEKVGGHVVRTQSSVEPEFETGLTNIISTERGIFSHIGMWRDIIEIFLHMLLMFSIM